MFRLLAILSCLLLLAGCARRAETPHVKNPSLHPIAANSAAVAAVSAEAATERRICFALGLLSLAAMFILRGLVPGFAFLAGACAAACAGGYIWSLFVTFAAPLLLWVILSVLLIGGAVVLWHFRRWILSPDEPTKLIKDPLIR